MGVERLCGGSPPVSGVVGIAFFGGGQPGPADRPVDPVCPEGHEFEARAPGDMLCVITVTQPASVSCPDAGVGETVVLRELTCVTRSTEIVAKEAQCTSDSGDPPAWTLSGTQCTRVVQQEYQHQTGQRRVAPFTTRVRVAPFTTRVRVAPFTTQVRVAPFTTRVRVAPFTTRVRVAPFTTRVRVAPFTTRVRVAPFTTRVRRRVPYTYTVRVRDRCVRWNYRNGGCASWRYRTETRTGYRIRFVAVTAYNYENKAVYNYRTRAVYNYENRAAYNYENKAVYNYRTRAVYNYENRAAYNYENRAVYNYEPVYETRTRSVAQSKSAALVCPAGSGAVGQRCARLVVTRTPATVSCTSEFTWTLSDGICSRKSWVAPAGCPSGYRLVPGYACELEPALPPAPTEIAPFGSLAGGQLFANDGQHSYVSKEDNDSERNHWQPIFEGPGGEDVYDKTDLHLYKVEEMGDGVDVSWEVAVVKSPAAAQYSCAKRISATVCGHGEITISLTATDLSVLLQNNLVCHELGHSIGFGHGTSKTSCMTEGENNKLDVWEIAAINSRY